MAIYVKKLNVPANTPESNPVSVDFVIKEKLLTKLDIVFPLGCNNMVGIKGKYGPKRFWPENPDDWIFGNNETVSWQEYQTLPEPNSKITFWGFSEGTTFDHTVIIRLYTLPKSVAAPGVVMEDLLEYLKSIF